MYRLSIQNHIVKISLAATLLLVCTAATMARIRLVPSEYSTIQTAIDASQTHDTVLVAPGRYFENIHLHGRNILLTSYYLIDRSITSIQSTIIDGSMPTSPDTASCVRIVSGEDSTMILQGFTIMNGNGTKWLDEHGGGVFREGGGILMQATSATIRFNHIINNHASNATGAQSAGGGAIRCGDGFPRILNNRIESNTGRYGGGIVLNYSGAIIRNNLIKSNSGGEDYGGGGIWSLSNGTSPHIIENNTIIQNASSLRGGGVYLWGGSYTLKNNILWGNTSAQVGPNLAVNGATANVSYCAITNGYAGIGNVSIDPRIVAPEYLLPQNSSAIDAGDPDSTYNDPPSTTNPALPAFPATGTLRNDIGAYGGPGAAELGILVTEVKESSENILPVNLVMLQTSPNPFNASIEITGTISFESPVSLLIYDRTGREINHLFQGNLTRGMHRWHWSPDNQASGVYYCTMRTNRMTKTIPLQYIK